MPPLRVLHMIGCLEVGGSQSMVMNIYRNIDRTKIQFDFIIDKEVGSPYLDEIVSLGGKIYKLPKFNGKNVFSLRKSWDAFFKEHREYKILHSHVRSYASLYLPIAKRNGLTTIIHSHSTSNGSGIASIAKKILQYPLRCQADYFFACSEGSGKWLFGNRITQKENFKIIPNAIDVKKYEYSEQSRKTIREEFGIDDQFVVGHIGRFIEAKNHMFLVDIFNEIHKELSDSVLLLVGDGELRKTVESKVRKLNLQDSVIFAGVRDDVPALLSAMDVFVFPSVYEGLGIVTIEAQASGLSVICSDAVPKEANLTNLIEYISLNLPLSIWKDKIINSKTKDRKALLCSVAKTNYNIISSVEYLEEFYIFKEQENEHGKK